ncbi:DNA-binding transcriptional regulator, MerR family [Sphingomonas sp. YR710]|uniref:MerR family transcriptional regulator n=1 Tax=Sphingomonas sp. YR710 TaxID=1882773 RepID=UPI000887F352|nr:MerR family transcriptional regulator [Sphingomonas sp. YR710]SDC25357.1 DNA-binding transcriptional regulator, MerR family [Sphingomonas sp. YR710]
MENILDISDVVRQTGLTARALRFYEARGLVRPLRTGSGRRVYGAGELARLNAIVALKRAGFSLAAIGRMLGARHTDLGRLVAAQLAEINARAAELAESRTLLLSVQSRIDRGEPIDVATLCSLIRCGESVMESENWKAVTDRYFTPKEKAHWADRAGDVPADFDQEAYGHRWSDLSARVEAALPLDPASERAQAFLEEWRALLEPFTKAATPQMMRGAAKLYDNMGEWQAEQTPPFAMAVWDFIKAAGAARAAD